MNTGKQFRALAICCLSSLSLTIPAQAPGTGARRGAVFGPDGRALPNVQLMFGRRKRRFSALPPVPIAASSEGKDFVNSGPGIVLGRGQRNSDFAMERRVSVTEPPSIQMRAEFWKMTNTPNFANSNNILGTSESFGRITAKFNNPLIVQLAPDSQF